MFAVARMRRADLIALVMKTRPDKDRTALAMVSQMTTDQLAAIVLDTRERRVRKPPHGNPGEKAR